MGSVPYTYVQHGLNIKRMEKRVYTVHDKPVTFTSKLKLYPTWTKYAKKDLMQQAGNQDEGLASLLFPRR